MITHPDKVLFPDAGITKGELARYYESIAAVMLPHVRGRPVTLERYPSGIAAKGFWQKDMTRGFPDWLERVEVGKKGGTVHHPLINDTRSLIWMANQNTITPHVWVSRVPRLFYPDVCVLDLDPSRDDRPDVLRRAALAIRDLLADLGLPSWVKTSGSKGFHILLSLDGASTTDIVERFAQTVGAMLVKSRPDDLTQEFSKADRGGRILIDTGRNGYSATFAAAYAVRARLGAPVSAPCTWEEVERGRVGPRSFSLRTMAARLDTVGDIWAKMADQRVSLQTAVRRLREMAPRIATSSPRSDDEGPPPAPATPV